MEGRVTTIVIGAVLIAGALYLAVAAPHYQIVVGENQSIAWRVDTHTGELATCTSPELPAAGCKSLPGSNMGYLFGLISKPQTSSAR
jgi:hypothetical protein